jgi:uncharacterized damage-inducible protein DinB
MLLIRRPAPEEHAPYYGRYIELVSGEDPIRALREGAEETRKFLESIPESKGDKRYAEGKWSVKELLVHVADAERVFAYRALRFARKDQTPLPGFDENLWAAGLSTSGRTVASIRDELWAVREATLAFFGNLDPEAWDRSGIANDVRMSVRAAAFAIAGHEIHHRNILRERYLR